MDDEISSGTYIYAIFLHVRMHIHSKLAAVWLKNEDGHCQLNQQVQC